jgi:hypothetical protein
MNWAEYQTVVLLAVVNRYFLGIWGVSAQKRRQWHIRREIIKDTLCTFGILKLAWLVKGQLCDYFMFPPPTQTLAT